MNETIDLNLIRVFAAVAEARSFTGAARRLGIPRPTISRRVAQLESELGVRLFQRTTRRVALSTAGAALHQRVALSLTTIDDAVGALSEVADAPGGRLRVTAPADLATALLPSIITRFLADHPGVSVELSVTNAFVDLVAEGFDCALRISTRKLSDSSLVAQRLGELPLRLFAAPCYLDAHSRPRRPSDLEKHNGVIAGGRRPVHLRNASRTATVEMPCRIETNDMLFAHRVALLGAGIGVLPAFLCGDDVAAGRLEHVLPRWRAQSGQLWILWPGGRHVPPKTRAFQAALEAALQRGVGG